MNRRGDSMTNVIIFIVLILAALIIVVWYSQNIRPTRYIIGTVSEDIDELGQHFANACGVSVYRSSYLVQTQTGQLIVNETAGKYCVVTDVFAACKSLPCEANSTIINLPNEPTLVKIAREDGLLVVT